MKRRTIAMFVSVLMACLLLAACSSSAVPNESGNNGGGSSGGTQAEAPAKSDAKEDVELTFLYQMDDRWTAEFWASVVSDFEKQNPGIKLNPMSYPSVDKKQEYIQTLYATDQMPDVTFAGLESMKLIDGVFLEVPEHLTSLLDETGLYRRDGKVYTLPTSKYIMLDVFYNKDIFKKYNLTPPNTWDEFLQLNETLKSNGVVPFVEAGQGVSGMMLHNPMLTVMLNEISEDYPQKFLSGEMKFNGPEMLEIGKRFQALWDAGYYHEGSLSFTGAQKDEKFMEGSAAMLIQGIFNAKKYAEGSQFEVGWFPLPGMKSADIYPVMFGEDIGVSAKTKHPEEAFKLVEFLFSDAVYQQIVEKGNAGYTTKKPFTYEQDYLTKEMYEITANKTAKITFMKIDQFPAATAELMRTTAQDIAHGGDVQQALDKMESMFRDVLKAENK
ncbi:MAG TPA: extracellular solute-binding protein [Paenibacillus sp.]|nr:extracellular solute-binding protein [Paenibacillus sp.]